MFFYFSDFFDFFDLCPYGFTFFLFPWNWLIINIYSTAGIGDEGSMCFKNTIKCTYILFMKCCDGKDIITILNIRFSIASELDQKLSLFILILASK
jgi:hypothetical protein